MNKQQARIKASVLTAAYLLVKRSQDAVMVSDDIFVYLGKIRRNYKKLGIDNVLDIINENIVYLNRSIDILDSVHQACVEHDDVLDLIYLEKARSELEAARFRCYDEEAHYQVLKPAASYADKETMNTTIQGVIEETN